MSSIRRRAWSALIVLLSALGASAATDSEIGLAGKVVDASGTAVGAAVVSLRQGEALPRLRGLSAADGSFRLGLADPSTRAGRAVRAATLEDALATPGPLTLSVQDLGGRRILGLPISGAVAERRTRLGSVLASLRPGLWIATLSDSRGRQLHAGKVLLDGRGAWAVGAAAGQDGAARAAIAGDTLVVRKAGYLPTRIALSSLRADLGSVVLRADPLEARIDSVLRLMTLDDKVGQMMQSNLDGSTPADARNSRLGSVLSGGNEALPVFSDWQNQALGTPRAIPLIYGIDAVHGNSKASGATIFPHNIGLGATRDADLVRRMGVVVAKEVIAKDMDFAFGPCVAVARDERWGRTYESFGESPEIAADLGAALVRGMQGDLFDAPWRVAACAKHYLADGGAEWGTGEHDIDQGDARISDSVMRAIHLPGYVSSVEAGVATVMASYSSINGQKMHGNKALLTDLLKTELGFDGFVISDWAAIAQLGGTGEQQVARSVNAGVDMLMEPGSWKIRIAELKACVAAGTIPQQRIDDAVRRILRVKYRMGRFSQPMPASTWDADFGSAAHRAVAREAVRKSLVVLKNDAAVLPLSKSGRKIAVVGTHADNTGLQCGGWTKVGGNDGTAWQGASGVVQGATSILAGFRSIYPGVQTATGGADVVVVVTGEQPYAEMQGDRADLALPTAAATQLASAKSAGQKTVLVVVSGRPLILGGAVQNADAVVAAWLPGSEGAGVADVLFGDFSPAGKLPCSWPARMDQVPINVGDADYASNPPLYPYGYGLTW